MGLFWGRKSTYQIHFERMQAENQLRLEYHFTCLSRKHGDLLRLMPLLLHLELNLFLPGLEQDALHGIAGYQPDDDTLLMAAQYFPQVRTLSTEKGALFEKKQPLEFLYLMGSAGTAAYSAGSDMDFWVGIEKHKYKRTELRNLQQKLTLIENWASQYQLELHFFLTDIADLRNDRYGELDGESCGSALGVLLKDEFYRSMLHLAGKYPKFWATPVGTQESASENKLFDRFLSDRLLKLLDIGAIHHVVPQELPGAVLWQILKGLHSPFKSVLKIALLEYYACADKPELLSHRHKRGIHTQKQVGRTDPYLAMIEQIRTYHLETGKDPAERRLLEECFLIKCLAGLDPQQNSKRFAFLMELSARWDFSPAEAQRLHRFRDWPYAESAALAKRIFDHYINTYKLLRTKALQTKGSVSERDLTVMGKTLRAYLEKQENKIPYHFSLLEARHIHMLRFGKARNASQQAVWTLLADFGGNGIHSKNVPLFEHPDILSVCAWFALNGYWHPRQKIALPAIHQYSVEMISAFFRQFVAFLPKEKILDQVLRTWNDKAEIKRIFLMPNALEPDNQDQLVNLTCYTLNSFGEMHTHQYSGKDSLQQLVAQLLIPSVDFKEFSKDSCIVFRYGSAATPRHRIALDIQQKMDALCEALPARRQCAS